jgi:hypothetical protein
MPSMTIPRPISAQQAANALQEQLGSVFTVTTHGGGSLTVRHGPLAFATVRLRRNGDATTFNVHGSGLIINRIINEFGIARIVTSAVKESLEPSRAS